MNPLDSINRLKFYDLFVVELLCCECMANTVKCFMYSHTYIICL